MPDNAEDPKDPAATADPVVPAATAPGAQAPVAASEPKKRKGFFASLIAGESEGGDEALKAEQEAHAATKAKLAEAEAKVKEFEAAEEAAESAYKAKVKEAGEAKAAAEKAKADAEAEKAKVPELVAAGVKDVLAGMGIEADKMPAAQDKPGKEGEHSHLKGRARAAAAFEAQLAN